MIRRPHPQSPALFNRKSKLDYKSTKIRSNCDFRDLYGTHLMSFEGSKMIYPFGHNFVSILDSRSSRGLFPTFPGALALDANGRTTGPHANRETLRASTTILTPTSLTCRHIPHMEQLFPYAVIPTSKNLATPRRH